MDRESNPISKAEQTKQLAAQVGRSVQQVEEDLKLIKHFRSNLDKAIDALFVKGPGWLHEPLVPFQREGVRRSAYGSDRNFEIWPRGHAKTTIIARALTALQVALGLHRSVAVISCGQDNYKSNLNAIYAALTLDKFAGVSWFLPYFYKDTTVRKAGSQIIIGDMEAVINFRSILGEMRGLNESEAGGRPTLIVPDDIIPTTAQRSMADRETILNNYMSVVEPLGEAGSKIAGVGTIMHPDDLVAKFSRGAFGFQTTPPKERGIYNEQTEDILWPELWTWEKIEEKREQYIKEGKEALFFCEYMNQPRLTDTYPLSGYPVKQFSFFDVNVWDMNRVIGIDHAHGTGNDYFAIAEYGMDWQERVFALNIQRSKDWNIDTRLRKTVELVSERRPNVLIVEDTSESRTFIELLERALENADIGIGVERTKPSARGSKNDHILGRCEPLIKNGRLYFPDSEEWAAWFDNEANAFDYHNRNNVDDLLDVSANCFAHLVVPSRPADQKSQLDLQIERTRQQANKRRR